MPPPQLLQHLPPNVMDEINALEAFGRDTRVRGLLYLNGVLEVLVAEKYLEVEENAFFQLTRFLHEDWRVQCEK